ncbi:MAG: transposase [Minisyncoccia bacterium]|uniref:transposase n=1 Tax=Roseiflexus castenholzii TaxID=120962 RepID=UPI003C7DFCF0
MIGALRRSTDRPLEGAPAPGPIVRNADGWDARIGCDVAPSPRPPTGKALGIDGGLESVAPVSDGAPIANPRSSRAAERTRQQAQRRLSRRVKGRNRRRKAREPLAKAHRTAKRARQDVAPPTARALVNDDDLLVGENARRGRRRRGGLLPMGEPENREPHRRSPWERQDGKENAPMPSNPLRSAKEAMRVLLFPYDATSPPVWSPAVVNDLAMSAASDAWAAAMALIGMHHDLLPLVSTETIRILGEGIARNAKASAFVLRRLAPAMVRDCPPDVLDAFGGAAARDEATATLTLLSATPEAWNALSPAVRHAIAVWARCAPDRVAAHLRRERAERPLDERVIRDRLTLWAPDALRMAEAMDAGDSSNLPPR